MLGAMPSPLIKREIFMASTKREELALAFKRTNVAFFSASLMRIIRQLPASFVNPVLDNKTSHPFLPTRRLVLWKRRLRPLSSIVSEVSVVLSVDNGMLQQPSSPNRLPSTYFQEISQLALSSPYCSCQVL